MLRPTHAKKQFKANRVFSGRKEERDLFSAACNQTDTKETYKVLNWYGVGGQGKSSLLREFQRQMAAHNAKVKENKSGTRLIPAKIDFEDERLKRVDAALYSLRRQLAQSSGFAFHTFDAAFVAYHTKTRPGMDIGSTYPELFKGEREGMMDLIDVLDDPLTVASHLASAALPGAGLIYKWGARLTGKLAKWWKTRGNELIAGIEALQPEQVLEKLPTFLGIDLCDGIEARPDRRPVVLLDTYEALWRNRGQKDGLADRRADAWVRLFVQDAPGTLFVIAGRDELRWSEIDEAWGKVVESRLLGALSDEDADQFLLEVPITEDHVRAKIIDSSQGLPFYLDLQVSHYETLKERGETPSEASFGGTPSDILARFLEHLSDNDQATLRLASYLQIITHEAMDELVTAFPDRAINYSFEQMVARSSFVEISDETFEIHALLKGELQRRESLEVPELFGRVHWWLFQWFEKQLESVATPKLWKDFASYFASAYQHLSFFNPVEGVKWFLDNKIMLEQRTAWDVHQSICLDAISAIEGLAENDEVKTYALQESHANSLFQRGMFFEARTMFLKARETLDGSESPRLIDLAHSDFNIAQAEIECGETSAAAVRLKSAISGFETDPTDMTVQLALAISSLAEIDFASGSFLESASRHLAASLLNTNYPANQSANLASLSEALHSLKRSGEAVKIFHAALSYNSRDLDEVYSPEALRNQKESSNRVSSNLKDVTTIAWMDSDEMAIFREREHFDPIPKIFKEPLRYSPKRNIASTSGGHSLIPPSILEEIHSKFPENTAYEYSDHPGSDLLANQVNEQLSSSETGASFLRILSHYEKTLIFLSAPGFDFGYSPFGNTVWVALPEETNSLKPTHLLCLIYALRTVDHDLIGFKPKRLKDGMNEWAGDWHAKCLDRIVFMFRHLLGLPDDMQAAYVDTLTEPAKELLRAIKANAPPEDLYRCYAYDLLGGS